MKNRTLIVAVCGIFICLGTGVVLVTAGVIRTPNAAFIPDPNTLYKVTHIDDGDTFRVDVNAHEITVRMLGMNTPETVDPRKKVECYGPEASDETKSLLKGRSVKLLLNPNRETHDKYGRYLAYVYRDDGMFINEFLLQNGFAREYTVGTPYSFQAEFRDVEAGAKAKGVGLWGKCDVEGVQNSHGK